MLGKFRNYSLRTQCLVIGIASALVAATSGLIGGIGVNLLGDRLHQQVQATDEALVARQIDAGVTTALLHAARYLAGHDPAEAKGATDALTPLGGRVAAAESGAHPGAYRALAAEMAAPLQQLTGEMERLIALTQARDDLVQGALRVLGPRLAEQASVLATGGAAGLDPRLASLARSLGQDISPVATAVENYLATGDTAHADAAGNAFRAVDDRVEQLSAYLATPASRASLDLAPLRTTLAQYRDTFARVQNAIAGQDSATTALNEAGDRVRSLALRMIEEGGAEAAASAARASSTFATVAVAITLWIIGALGLAIVLSVLGARAMARLIAEPVDEMRRLAAGDASIRIDAARRPDMLGAMGKALVLLRDATLEKAALEARADEERHLADEQARQSEDERRRVAEELAHVVGALSTAMRSLSQGDLTVRITAGVAERYEKLKEDFNFAVSRLEETVAAAKAGTDSIRTGSSEIALATDDLSRRTESQAANLQETAAAVHEITATVQKTAEGAALARTVVSSAKAEAEKGGDVVRKAVDAMGAIEASSKQINQIIGVIDEIAFQTNLLALNAGVEAARAGDAGRGFAVVASEVRALAQRSADAARQIKDLISTSTDQVDEGVMLVEQTGRALEGIVEGVSEINTLVMAIAAGAQEQATGLQQVNSAVNQMDQVTQQNAAMVEEATAATRSLSEQTEDLVRLVGRFRTNDGEASRTTPSVGVFSAAGNRQATVPFPMPPAAPRAKPPAQSRKRAATGGAAPTAGADFASLQAADNWEEF